ncbi:MAG: hypothetical protein GY711_17280 [bacterium]|nr:hypothetical protein [bacterium]
MPPGASGILCVASPQFRYTSVPDGHLFQFDSAGISSRVGGSGSNSLPTDGSYPPVPAVMSGMSQTFQAWYRDGASSNFSDAYIVILN